MLNPLAVQVANSQKLLHSLEKSQGTTEHANLRCNRLRARGKGPLPVETIPLERWENRQVVYCLLLCGFKRAHCSSL